LDIYGIPEASTIYRGTFRFRGWCETLDAMKRFNMLDDTPVSCAGKSYHQFLAERSGLATDDLKRSVAAKLGVVESADIIRSFEFLGFFSDEILDYTETTPFELTSDRMINRMSLQKNERDMVVMQHIFLAAWPDGSKEVIKSSMLDFGSPATNTAIARTVALPASIAVKLILARTINLKGVYRPVHQEIYNPIIEELKTLGIEMKEQFGLPESEMIN
ncbi:MAG: hypothetical protein IQL11_05380, partial [Bacteroidales bacterium]|nr:hypothetical protein [Bacteroidales bacterium]